MEEGHVASLVEAALRFPLGSSAVSTVLLGYSSQEHLEAAATAVGKGPLLAGGPRAARGLLEGAWREAR